jgi:CheY-like chemotaxis protein
MNSMVANSFFYNLASRADLKVLVVDDDSFQLEAISGILHDLGFAQITQASSGSDALRLMGGKAHFDLVVTDLHMPGMDGFLFMEQVAGDGYGGALIIVSGQGGDVMHAASLVARLRRFKLLGSIKKPVSRAAFVELFNQFS